MLVLNHMSNPITSADELLSRLNNTKANTDSCTENAGMLEMPDCHIQVLQHQQSRIAGLETLDNSSHSQAQALQLLHSSIGGVAKVLKDLQASRPDSVPNWTESGANSVLDRTVPMSESGLERLCACEGLGNTALACSIASVGSDCIGRPSDRRCVPNVVGVLLHCWAENCF